MIYIEFKTDKGQFWLADVVNRKIKMVRDKKSYKPDAQWLPYQELKGGQAGETLTIIWPLENDSAVLLGTSTYKIDSLRFTE